MFSRILEDLYHQKISPDLAAKKLKFLPFAGIKSAKVDTHREIRSGFPEIIFCERKTPAQVVSIAQKLHKAHGRFAASRASETHAEALLKKFDSLEYDDVSRIARAGNFPKKGRKSGICVITAGTSDIPVAEEAAVMAELAGNSVDRVFDVGVAGVHRLLDQKERIEKAAILVVAAGMEGALPSLTAGMFGKPIIAVPTSVGYGANFAGLSALLGMLNSCALGVCVVNIDNGLGAGYLASQFNALRYTSKSKSNGKG